MKKAYIIWSQPSPTEIIGEVKNKKLSGFHINSHWNRNKAIPISDESNGCLIKCNPKGFVVNGSVSELKKVAEYYVANNKLPEGYKSYLPKEWSWDIFKFIEVMTNKEVMDSMII